MNIPLKTSVAAIVSKWQISLSKMLIFMFMRQFKTLTASTRQSVKNEWLTATACGEAHHCMAMMLKSKVFGGFFWWWYVYVWERHATHYGIPSVVLQLARLELLLSLSLSAFEQLLIAVINCCSAYLWLKCDRSTNIYKANFKLSAEQANNELRLFRTSLRLYLRMQRRLFSAMIITLGLHANRLLSSQPAHPTNQPTKACIELNVDNWQLQIFYLLSISNSNEMCNEL